MRREKGREEKYKEDCFSNPLTFVSFSIFLGLASPPYTLVTDRQRRYKPYDSGEYLWASLLVGYYRLRPERERERERGREREREIVNLILLSLRSPAVLQSFQQRIWFPTLLCFWDTEGWRGETNGGKKVYWWRGKREVCLETRKSISLFLLSLFVFLCNIILLTLATHDSRLTTHHDSSWLACDRGPSWRVTASMLQ